MSASPAPVPGRPRTVRTTGGRPDPAGAAAGEPKYYRVKRHLLAGIDRLPPGSPVPPERVLSAELGTSRTTVRQALAELVVEGRLERVQGRGTFVAAPKMAWPLQLTSYTEDVRAHGLNPTSRVIDVSHVGADPELAGLLDLRSGGRVWRIERLRLADGEPMAIEVTHLPARRFPNLRRRLADRTHRADPADPADRDAAPSLYQVLEEGYGVRLGEAEQTIETVLAPPREARLLDVETGSPMLALTRLSRDTEARPVEWVRSVYRGDRYKFVARLTRF